MPNGYVHQISILHRNGSVTVCCGTLHDGACHCDAPGMQAMASKVETFNPVGRRVGLGLSQAFKEHIESKKLLAMAMDNARTDRGLNVSPINSRR